MASRLERQWWFIAPTSALAALVTTFVMDQAAIAHPYNAAQWLLYFLCFTGVQRAASLLGWLLVLALAPSNKLLERTR